HLACRSVQPGMELGEGRRALRLAQLEVRFLAERRLALAHAALDRVQPTDEVQRDARPTLCMALHLARFVELATRMRPASPRASSPGQRPRRRKPRSRR